jgi:uncharacterized protein (TIGR00730 family)
MNREQEEAPLIAVLGSARLGEDDPRWSQAYDLGRLLAGAGYTVMTGGYGGLMAAVARGAFEAGGRAIGLPMRNWRSLQPNPWQSELRWSLHYGERLAHILNCQAAIALPGGVGTLSELTLCWSAAQTEGRPAPLILLGEHWPALISSIASHLVVNALDLALLRFAGDAAEALRLLEAARLASWPPAGGLGPYG